MKIIGDVNSIKIQTAGGDPVIEFSNQAISFNGTFWENNNVISSSYTISQNKNALTAGPITLPDGVIVTVPDGSEWTIL